MTQPAFPISYPSINNTRHSWAQVESNFNSKLIRGFTGVKYKSDLKPAFVRGAASQPIDRTLGDYEVSGAGFTMLMAEMDNFLQSLTNGGATGTHTTQFPITVQYLANGLQIITHKLIGCRITSIGSDAKPSVDGLVQEVEISCMLVILNNLSPLDPVNMLSGYST